MFMNSEMVARSDPQLFSLNCCFGCNDTNFKNLSAVARHLSHHHPERSDFPVLTEPYISDLTASTTIGHHVVKELDFLIFMKLKMVSFAGRAVPAFKRVNLKIACPPGAFYSIMLAADLRARWTPSGNLIVQNAKGDTLKSLLGTSCLEREFTSYRAKIDANSFINMRLVANLAKDRDNHARKETYWLKIGVVVRSERRRLPPFAEMTRVML